MEDRPLGFIADAECYGCKRFPDYSELFDLSLKTIAAAGMKVEQHMDQTFSPTIHGDNAGDSVMCLILPLDKSSFDIHSWPRWDYVHVHLFTCGSAEKAVKAVEELIDELQPSSVDKDFRAVGTRRWDFDPKMAERIKLRGGDSHSR